MRLLEVALVLDDGQALPLGRVAVAVEGRKGIGDMFAGALMLPEERSDEALDALVDVMLAGAARTWLLAEEDEPVKRGRFYLETFNRAAGTRVVELTLAGTGEPLTEESTDGTA